MQTLVINPRLLILALAGEFIYFQNDYKINFLGAGFLCKSCFAGPEKVGNANQDYSSHSFQKVNR